MATLVLQYAGAAVGGLLGGPLGGAIGRARSARHRRQRHRPAPVRRRRQHARRPAPRQICTSWPRPRARRSRASRAACASPGQVIWATDFEEVVSTRRRRRRRQGRRRRQRPRPSIILFREFRGRRCAKGRSPRIGRVWADGKRVRPRAASRCALLSRRRGPGARQPDRREGGRGQRAGLSRHRLCRVRAPAARALRQPPAAALLRGRPRRSAALRDHVRAVNADPRRRREFGYDTADR